MADVGQWLKRRGNPLAFGVFAVAMLVATIIVSSAEEPNRLASGILQGGSLLFGIYSSYLFGQISAEKAAMEIIRPHARSSFRRSLNLYKALGRQKNGIRTSLTHLDQVAITIRRANKDVRAVEFAHIKGVLQGLEAIVIEQISTADDSLEDWRDIIPDEVAEIENSKKNADIVTFESFGVQSNPQQLDPNGQ